MLYTSTRGEKDAFTAPRTLSSDIAPDGGLFVPFRFPIYSPKEIRSFAELSFGESVAKILNLFFSSKLTGWDVDFAVGRMPVKFFRMNHRLIVGELWHNVGGDYSHFVNKLYERICLAESSKLPTDWARVALRIAVLFGVFSRLMSEGFVGSDRPLDLALNADDFTLAMAAWYCRKMGLPIGVIICGCIGNSGLWDLLSRGEYSAASVPEEIWLPHERIVYETLGVQASAEYSRRCAAGRPFLSPEESFERLRSGIFASVVGKERVNSLVNSVFTSSGYRFSEEAAVAFGALQDYRAGNNEGRSSLILADSNPGI